MKSNAATAASKGGGHTTVLSSIDNQRAFPDLELPVPPDQAPIYIFGVLHGEMDAPGAADFILSSRPAAVVCETSLTPAHGAATGSILRLEDCLSQVGSGYGGSGDARARYLAQVAARLDTSMYSSSPSALIRGENDDDGDDDADDGVWSQLCAHTPSEQLAYIATFAVGADLIFGDRPKIETYTRLLWLPSLVDLDRAFGAKARENYEELAGELWPGDENDKNGDEDTLVVHRILMLERDAWLLSTLNNASIKAGPHSIIVGLVGRGHLPGLAELWESNTWQDLLTTRTTPMDSNTSDDGDDELYIDSQSEVYGVRRALFDGILRLTCQSDVLDDVARTLPDLDLNLDSKQERRSSSIPAWEAYHSTHEIYGNCRMLLAALSREELEAVCQGWRCDMYDLLEEVRKVRPVNGGKGWSEELVMKLRMLNFEMAVQGEEE